MIFFWKSTHDITYITVKGTGQKILSCDAPHDSWKDIEQVRRRWVRMPKNKGKVGADTAHHVPQVVFLHPTGFPPTDNVVTADGTFVEAECDVRWADIAPVSA